MAEAVEHAFETGEHLAVQAGTGTGKSLAYLVPAIKRAIEKAEPVVISRRPSRCSASCSIATCRGWPTPSWARWRDAPSSHC